MYFPNPKCVCPYNTDTFFYLSQDAPVPYATEMEKEMVKRASDLVIGVKSMC